jgi:flavin-dependent dehydrogenase
LDKLLIDAAVEAGVEFRPECAVDGILRRGGTVTGVRGRHRGAVFEEAAKFTVGADGRHSLIARQVAAPEYDRHPSITCFHYAYWRDLPTDALEVWIRPGFSMMIAPTNDGLTIGLMVFPVAEFPRVRMDVAGTFREATEAIPEIAERFASATRQCQFFGTADLPNFYRRPYGDGWALVGDAGYHKDPYTAQGISDAFRQAALLASALGEGLRETRPVAHCLQDYEAIRNESTKSIYAMTHAMASHEPPAPDVARILTALPVNQDQANRFLGIFAGTVRYEDFFDPQNVNLILEISRTAVKQNTVVPFIGVNE